MAMVSTAAENQWNTLARFSTRRLRMPTPIRPAVKSPKTIHSATKPGWVACRKTGCAVGWRSARERGERGERLRPSPWAQGTHEGVCGQGEMTLMRMVRVTGPARGVDRDGLRGSKVEELHGVWFSVESIAMEERRLVSDQDEER